MHACLTQCIDKRMNTFKTPIQRKKQRKKPQQKQSIKPTAVQKFIRNYSKLSHR